MSTINTNYHTRLRSYITLVDDGTLTDHCAVVADLQIIDYIC